jgi:histidinol-phosphate aminotransferase
MQRIEENPATFPDEKKTRSIMAQTVSRRHLLRGALLAGAALPFARIQHTINAWRAEEFGPIPAPGKTPYIRLGSNENPYGPSPKARKALADAIDAGNRYPGQGLSDLRQAIAEYESLTPEQILITAGSSELLGIAGLMAGTQGGRIIASHPTFPFLMRYASQFSAEWIKVPVTEDHQYNLVGITKEVNDKTRLVFLCNPNNPTGAELPRSILDPYCKLVSEQTMVYVDEAYIEFADGGVRASLASLTRDNPNIIIGRTFSKIYGMAGLRIGYAIAHPDTIDQFERYSCGANMTPSVTSLAAARASLGDDSFIAHCLEMNQETKDMVYAKFQQWGIEYIPSSTNFVFFRTSRFGSANVVQAMQEKYILIRDYGDVPGWARVSMGTVAEIQSFLDALEGMLM